MTAPFSGIGLLPPLPNRSMINSLSYLAGDWKLESGQNNLMGPLAIRMCRVAQAGSIEDRLAAIEKSLVDALKRKAICSDDRRSFHLNGPNQEFAIRCYGRNTPPYQRRVVSSTPLLGYADFPRRPPYPFISPRTPNPPLMATKTRRSPRCERRFAIDLTVSLPKI